MKCKLTATKSKTFAVTAAIATAIILMQTPAEARRYKHKVVRHHVTATAPAYTYRRAFGAGHRYVHRANRAARVRGWRAASGARHWPSARMVTRRVRQQRASAAPVAPMAGFGSSSLVAQARRYLGTNPTGMGALWCARFMNMVLEKSGRRGTGSNMASSFAGYGRRVAGPQVGAIAVMSRGRRGGHVGVVSGIDKSGNPIIISGNHNRRVGESVYPRGRIYAYVMP
jgi:uncharacterized protein (TIGR02594 family)